MLPGAVAGDDPQRTLRPVFDAAVGAVQAAPTRTVLVLGDSLSAAHNLPVEQGWDAGAVRSLLHRAGYRFRIHVRGLPGTPDVVLPKYRTVVFVHGCFWHRHRGCKIATMPHSHVRF